MGVGHGGLEEEWRLKNQRRGPGPSYTSNASTPTKLLSGEWSGLTVQNK